jgi:aminopeptidase N
MKYKNPRTGHTIAVELVVLEYAIVERDWEGKIVAILAEDESKREAQRKLDSLAKSMNWEEA